LACFFLLAFLINAWVFRGYIYRYVVLPPLYRAGAFGHLEQIAIDLKHMDYQRLAYKRELALERGVLMATDEDYVPATITHNGKQYRVKLRLKGDDKDHWEHKEKWSLRIKVRDDQTLFGLRKFSIQHPRTRGYLIEWLFHKYLEHSGLIYLKYDFIEVTLNGKRLGVYALEEHFDKILVEGRDYREGPIVRFNDDLYWKERIRGHGTGSDYQEAFWSGSIDVYGQNKIEAKKLLTAQYLKAKNLLEGYRRGEMAPDQIFNTDQLALFFAALDLWGNPHAHEYHNVRFYYNPITSLLEPIGYDTTDMGGVKVLAGSSDLDDRKEHWVTWEKRLFDDNAFFVKYVHALRKISQKEFLDEFFRKITPEYNRTLNILRANFPKYHFKGTEPLYEDRKFIENALNPSQGIQAYLKSFDDKGKEITVQVGNVQAMPLEILSLSVNGHVIASLPQAPVLKGKAKGKSVDFTSVTFKLLAETDEISEIKKKLKVQYRLLGGDIIFEQLIIARAVYDPDFLEQDVLRQPSNIDDFSFLKVDDTLKEIMFSPGVHTLSRDLIVLEGYVLRGGPDTKIILSNGAKIISFSPLDWVGTEGHPFILMAQDTTGQGLVVLNAPGRSRLEYVNFDNLAAPRGDVSWAMTGAVNFYQSPVDIAYCLFSGNRDSDDALNIIRSSFSIQHSVFEDSFSDAIDLDFSDGEISYSKFLRSGVKNNGGDAIDFSGSVVRVHDVVVDQAGDKGLSIGESSQVSAENIEIKGALVGIASKDSSEARLHKVQISECKTGLALYQKKPQFGPAAMEASDVHFKDVSRAYSVRNSSELILDGNLIKSTGGDSDEE